MYNKVKQYVIDRNIIFVLYLLSPILSFLNIPGKLVIVSFLFIFSLWYYIHFKGLKIIIGSFPLILWLLLTIYHWINAMQKKVPEVDFLDLIHGLKIYSCIGIFTYLARKNFDQTIKSLFVCFGIYLLMSFFINDTSSDEFNGRMSGAIFATGLGQTAALSGIYIAYYTLRNNIGLFKTAAFYLLPISVILFTQSRNSLAMIAICMIGHSIAYSNKKGTNIKKSILSISIIGIILVVFINFLIHNTEIGARLSDTENAALTAENNSIETGTIFDTIVGDRLVYYVKGWRLFIESPWTGIGMWNYEYVSQGNYPLHSEYMIHLAEGGIIAATIWLLFVFLMIHGVIKADMPQFIKIIAIFSIIEILFCGIYARLFYYEFFYPIIGIALSFSHWGQPKIKSQIQSVK